MSQPDCQTSWKDNDDHHYYCHHHHHHIVAAYVAFEYRFDKLTSPDRTRTVTAWEQNALEKMAEPRETGGVARHLVRILEGKTNIPDHLVVSDPMICSPQSAFALKPDRMHDRRRPGADRWPPRSPDLKPCNFFLWGYVKDSDCLPPVPQDVPEVWRRVITAISDIDRDMLQRVWEEMVYLLEVCHVPKGRRTVIIRQVKQTCRVPLSFCRSHVTILYDIQVYRFH